MPQPILIILTFQVLSTCLSMATPTSTYAHVETGKMVSIVGVNVTAEFKLSFNAVGLRGTILRNAYQGA